MTDFYVQGHTAEGAPYGPVYVLSVDEEGRVLDVEDCEGKIGRSSPK